MIKKDCYIIIGIKEDGTEEVLIPYINKDFGIPNEYYYDYHEVIKYIKENVGLKYKTIFITKIIESMNPSLNIIENDNKHFKFNTINGIRIT